MTTPSAFQSLFPKLSPELREMVYTQIPSSTGRLTNEGLPFGKRIYSNKRWTVTLEPMYRGNPSLLALGQQGFIEGSEYREWLLRTGAEVRIHVYLESSLAKFDLAQWKMTMEKSLEKLGKKHPWIRKLPNHHIQILYIPPAWSKPVGGQLSLGKLSLDILGTFKQFMHDGIRSRRGCIKTHLQLADYTAPHLMYNWKDLMLGDFISSSDTTTRWEVRQFNFVSHTQLDYHSGLPPPFYPVSASKSIQDVWRRPWNRAGCRVKFVQGGRAHPVERWSPDVKDAAEPELEETYAEMVQFLLTE